MGQSIIWLALVAAASAWWDIWCQGTTETCHRRFIPFLWCSRPVDRFRSEMRAWSSLPGHHPSLNTTASSVLISFFTLLSPYRLFLFYSIFLLFDLAFEKNLVLLPSCDVTLPCSGSSLLMWIFSTTSEPLKNHEQKQSEPKKRSPCKVSISKLKPFFALPFPYLNARRFQVFQRFYLKCWTWNRSVAAKITLAGRHLLPISPCCSLVVLN